MLVVEPAEPCIYNVRLRQAYRTTVTLRNDTRNALELTVRAGSPERWAVAPSTVFLEAGRTMRVDLRLKLAREIRPKKTAGAAVREGDDEGGGAVRQRDVFHVKGEFFEQKFYASFVMATQEEVAAMEEGFIRISNAGIGESYDTSTVTLGGAGGDGVSGRGADPGVMLALVASRGAWGRVFLFLLSSHRRLPLGVGSPLSLGSGIRLPGAQVRCDYAGGGGISPGRLGTRLAAGTRGWVADSEHRERCRS